MIPARIPNYKLMQVMKREIINEYAHLYNEMRKEMATLKGEITYLAVELNRGGGK